MNTNRLDYELVKRGLVPSRSQAESWIKLGKVTINGRVATKGGHIVTSQDKISLEATEQYVSRAGLKLASVAQLLNIDFRDKTVLDVGSSTGGFTDYALRHGAKKVFAVDVGTDQLHPSLRNDERIELHEKTDIRDVWTNETRDTKSERGKGQVLIEVPDIVVIDVSFVSLRDILPHVSSLVSRDSVVVAMLKPQFEAGKEQINKGIIKNDSVRRQILKDFEQWSKQYFIIRDKKDSEVHGSKGNQERFYLLQRSA